MRDGYCKGQTAVPGLKFIGGFNKLTIEEGKEAIDREFERILPVIRSGGYVRAATIRLRRTLPLTITGIISNG